MKKKQTKHGAIEKAKNLLAQITKQKEVLARERDKLRELVSEVEDIAESFDGGLEGVENGVDLLQRALDEISQYV